MPGQRGLWSQKMKHDQYYANAASTYRVPAGGLVQAATGKGTGQRWTFRKVLAERQLLALWGRWPRQRPSGKLRWGWWYRSAIVHQAAVAPRERRSRAAAGYGGKRTGTKPVPTPAPMPPPTWDSQAHDHCCPVMPKKMLSCKHWPRAATAE